MPQTFATLGNRRVNRIGYGAMQLSDRESGRGVLRLAVELSVDHVDTADFYGGGLVNELIREALHPYEGVALVSKVGARHTSSGLVAAQRPEELRADVEANLRHLGVERLAVVNLRRTDRAPGVVATGDQLVDLDDQLATMAALREEGKIEAIGLSTVTVEQVESALSVGIACVQNPHSVLNREDEPVLELCRAHDIAWVPYFPLGSAFAGLPKVADDPTVQAVAQEVGATPAQVGLAWELAHDPHTLLIPGTSSADHLRENLAVSDVVLTADQLARLDALA